MIRLLMFPWMRWLFLFPVTFLIASCFDGVPPLADDFTGKSERFSIDSYTVSTSASDLSGLWVAIHSGTMLKAEGNVDYNITGSIREVVRIQKIGEEYYVRSCLESEEEHVLSISGDDISFEMNLDQVELTKVSNTRLSGSASHDLGGSSYSGTLEMKKVAVIGDDFGAFSFYASDSSTHLATASCFQDGYLRVVGKMFGISQWADVEVFTAADWLSDSDYEQLSYLISREGSADPVKQMQFIEGGLAVPMPYVREYEGGLSVTTTVAEVNAYHADIIVDAVMSGAVDLVFDIGVSGGAVVLSSSGDPEEESPVTGGVWGDWSSGWDSIWGGFWSDWGDWGDASWWR